MKKKEEISAIYRNQVSRIVESHDATDWPGSLGPGETEEIWEDISAMLDIDEVWGRISAGLGNVMPSSRGPGFLHKGCAAILVILAALVHVEKTVPYDNPATPSAAAIISYTEPVSGFTGEDYDEGKLATPNSHAYASSDIQITSDAPEIRDKPTMTENESKITGLTISIPEVDNKPIAVEVISDRAGGSTTAITLASTDDKPGEMAITYRTPPEIRKLTVFSDPASLVEEDPGKSMQLESQWVDGRRFTGGLITSFRNTWLLNQETFDGLRSESLRTTEIMVFPDAGLRLSYLVTERLAVQADVFLNSNTGQGYREYIFGRYSRKKIVLRYSTIAASLKYKTDDASVNPNRSSFNISAGAYISFLHNADQKIGADVRKISSSYRRFDFGTRVSGEFEIHLNKYLSVAPGLNLTAGLTNVYKGTSRIPGYLRKTHNASAGLQLSLYWILD